MITRNYSPEFLPEKQSSWIRLFSAVNLKSWDWEYTQFVIYLGEESAYQHLLRSPHVPKSITMIDKCVESKSRPSKPTGFASSGKYNFRRKSADEDRSQIFKWNVGFWWSLNTTQSYTGCRPMVIGLEGCSWTLVITAPGRNREFWYMLVICRGLNIIRTLEDDSTIWAL